MQNCKSLSMLKILSRLPLRERYRVYEYKRFSRTQIIKAEGIIKRFFALEIYLREKEFGEKDINTAQLYNWA